MIINSPLQRQKLFPLHLKIIQIIYETLASLRSYGNQKNCSSLMRIESNSYSKIKLENFSRSDFIKDKFDLDNFLKGAFESAEESEIFDLKRKSFFWYRRKNAIKKSDYNFGYDVDMVEFVNSKDYCLKFFGKERWSKLIDIVNLISHEISSLTRCKLSTRFYKIYFYDGVVHPRPLHYDSFNNLSYKVFIFLGGEIKTSQGPYAVIPGSHGKLSNKIMNFYNKSKINRIWGNETDGSFFNSRSAVKFENLKDNEIVITKQNAIHGDFPSHGKNYKKTALVFHLLPDLGSIQ